MAKDYQWLQTSVVGFTHRSDLLSKLPDFVMLAEDRLSSDIEAHQQDSTTTLSTTAGVATVSLPTGLIELKSMAIPERGAVDYLSPAAFEAKYAIASPGEPKHYTVIGSQIKLGPVPDAAYSLNCVVRLALTPLAEAVGGVNWLIAAHPSIYLAATMCEVCLYTKDAAAQATWEQKYANALALVNGKESGAASSLAVRPDTNTP